MLEKTIRDALEYQCKVKKNEKFILAFSGGSDSVCLLHVLAHFDYKFIIAYFNHNLRTEVLAEEQFTIETARKYGYEYAIGSARIEEIAEASGRGIEETAREYRYQFLCDTAKKQHVNVIAAAHHADDQVETILMNLIRGSGLHGLTGMPYRSMSHVCKDKVIIRPMLAVWKNEIMAYCRENHLNFREDITNQDIYYTRNNLRREIIPKIECINPQFKSNLLRTQSILEGDELMLQEAASQMLSEVMIEKKEKYIKLDIQKFRAFRPALQRRLIISGLKTQFFLEKDISYLMVENIRRVMRGDIESNFTAITDQIMAACDGKNGFIYSDPNELIDSDTLCLPDQIDRLDVPYQGETRINLNWSLAGEIIPRTDLLIDIKAEDHRYRCFIDRDALQKPLIVRKWRRGDRFAPMGMQGKSMKVSDFWINKKFPKRYRANWPIICDRDEIIWIPGFQPAFKAMVTPESQTVLMIQFVKHET